MRRSSNQTIYRITLLATVCFASPASGQEATTTTFLDFMVDWPDMIGQTVHVTGGKVVAAGIEFAQLSGPGGNIILRPPWADREDLRYLFQNCTSILTGDDCELPVTGTVKKSGYESKPELVNVDFHIQR